MSTSSTASASRKKVLVRRFSGDVLPGYLPLYGFVRCQPALSPEHPNPGDNLANSDSPTLDLLDLHGRVLTLPLRDIKHVSYIRDFNLSDPSDPERIVRKTFLARPRSEGLWLRITFRTGDILEGLAPADAGLLDALIADCGLHVTPPDIRSNTQKIYVPRSSIAQLQLLAVITTPSKRKPAGTDQPGASKQEDLFRELPTGTSLLN